MASKIKYSLCLVVMSLAAAIHVSAQYSEQDLIEEANTLFEDEAFAEAMPLYSQLLSLNPTNPVFNYKYGATALYGDADKKEEAVKYLKFSIGKPGVDDESWYYLARAYHLNYLFQDAITAYEKYKTLASNSEVEDRGVDLKISMARSGLKLLSQIKEIKVLDKKQSSAESFFRIYDLSDIGGKILVTPEELLSSEDKKRNHKSLIHFRGTGTTIYFSSYGKNGKSGLDIYRADVLPDGSFTEPTPIQGAINTPYDEDFPYLHPDDKTFYFSSKGHGSMGGYDVYKSGFDKGSGVFSKPTNLDFAVNTPDDDLFYLADSLNEMAYFASARSSKQGQLDVYKVLVKSAPLDITLIKGTFINQIDPTKKLAKITTVDARTNKEVDVQYTDPSTGEYVLSFPKGGKYKFLVEEKSSDKIHAGLVDVPSSAGVVAYLQEMELISSAGVEKLLINNLFDQTYDGDVMALAQKMLRQRAALDVNFDPSEEPDGQDEPEVEKDPALAFSDAGFGAGMSNEKILEQAEARVEELKDRQVLAAQLAEGAAQSSEAYFEIAEQKKSAAQTFISEAGSTKGDTRNESMYGAGLAKLQAKEAMRKANNAKNLKAELHQAATEAKMAYEEEKARVDSLREAIDSNNYDAIYAGLIREQSERKRIDKVRDRFDPVQDIRREGLKSDSEASKLLKRAQNLRDREEQLSASLVTKRTQQKKLKGKELKEIEEEIAVLKSDIEAAKRKTERAFKQAEDAQILADNGIQEYQILQEIVDANDPSSVPIESEPLISWSDSDKKVFSESLQDLPIDDEAVAAYVAEHPEVFEEMASEEMAMNFRRTFGSGSESDLNVSEQDQTEDQPEAVALADSQNQPGEESESPETKAEPIETIKSDEIESDLTENELADADLKDDLSGAEDLSVEEDLAFVDSLAQKQTDTKPEDLSIQFDESLPVAKRIETEELKIEAAEDWVAIIEESIEQLEGGVGGEEGAEEQLANYTALRDQKIKEIEARRELITEWSEEIDDASESEEIALARADIDTLSPSLVARIESKIPDYSTQTNSIRSVSAIDRNYLPALAEIEISGLSAPEVAEKRIELNERLIADIGKILNEGIDSEVSQEDLIEMRRVKILELQQDEAIMEGKASFQARSAEAKSYAELIKEVPEEEATEIDEPETAYTKLSPAMAESLSESYSKESVFPDYTALMEEAKLTANPEIEKIERLKIKEELLNRLQSEISIYKAAIEAADKPNPELIERYGVLLRERSEMIDDINEEKKDAIQPEVVENQIELSADSLIAALRQPALSNSEKEVPTFTEEEIEVTNEKISARIDDYVAILDNPEAGIDRDQVQLEIQKLEAFQKEFSASINEADKEESREEDLMTPQDANEPNELGESTGLKPEESKEEEVGEPTSDLALNVSENNESSDIEEIRSDGNQSLEKDELSETTLSEIESKESEEILSITEGLVLDFDQKTKVLNEETKANGRELEAMAELNVSFVSAIEGKIDSLNRVKLGAAEEVQQLIEQEIIELQALSADKQQESDRLLAEAELVDVLESKDVSAEVKSNAPTSKVVEDAPLIAVPDLSDIQYKSLNASIIRNDLKTKADSLAELKREYNELTSDSERAAVLSKIERINAEVREGINRSNFAEIEYYQRENQRILSQLDPNASTNREEIIALQAESNELSSEVRDPEQVDDAADQFQLIEKLAEVNASLGSFTEAAAINENNERLGEMTSAIISPDSHLKAPNKAYLTEMQAVVVSKMSREDRNDLMVRDRNLNLNLDFLEENSIDNKRSIVESNTTADSIGMELLLESPEQLNYLVAMVTADSLKMLEKEKALYAELNQKQAIESSLEADRLLKMLPNQETDRDRKSVKERAKKLEGEAEVFYEKSSLAAEQAELIRSKRSENDQVLIALTTELSFKQRRMLDQLLLKPGYRIIPSEEVAEETPTEEPLAEVAENIPGEPVPNSISDRIVSNEISEEVTPEGNTNLDDLKGNWLGMVEIIAEKEDFSDVEESMFVEAKSSVYNEDQPIPVDPVMPNGLIFQVQVGAYRNPIPQDLFGAYAPIMGQKLDNGITRYRAGLFKKYGEAIQARDEIKTKGYSDAFVVVYVNGEKLTGDEARQILAQAKEKETINIELVSGVPSDEPLAASRENTKENSLPNTDYYNDPEAAEAEQVEVITGLFYTVQVGVYSKPVKLGQLYNLTELNSELTSSGVIRYTSGRFGGLAAAADRKEVAKDKGVSDAFITAYYNGKRISLAEAEKLLAENGKEILANSLVDQEADKVQQSSESIKDSEETYVVIMGTFVDEVPQELVNLFLQNKSWGIRKIQGPGSAAIYLTEDLPSLQDAEELLMECKKLNIQSAAIGTIENGKITSVRND